MARPRKIHKYDYTIRTLAYYQQQGGIYNDIITILQKLRQTCVRDRIGTAASILNEACFLVDDYKNSGRDLIDDMEEFKRLNCDRISSGTMDLIFACVYVLAFNIITEGARQAIIHIMNHQTVDVSDLFKLAEEQEDNLEPEPEQEPEQTPQSDPGMGEAVEKDGKVLVRLLAGPMKGLCFYTDPKTVSTYNMDEPPEYVKMLKDMTNQLAAKEKQLQEYRKAMKVADAGQQVRSYKADIKMLSDNLDATRRDLLKVKKERDGLRAEIATLKKKSDNEISHLTETCSIRELEKEKLRNEVAVLKQMLDDAVENNKVDVATIDDVLTFDYTLKYIEDKEVYEEVKQLFEFLKRAMRRIATDEQYDQLDALEKKMLHNSLPSIHNHNQISNSNVIQGVMHNPSFPMGIGNEDLQKLFMEFLNEKLNHGKSE